jgi:hypothetical protein
VRRAAWLLPALLVATGCATRVFTPPAGPAEPFPDAPRVWEDVTTRCRDAQRYVAEMRVQGWAGARDQRIANTLHGAVTRTDDIYLEMYMFSTLAFQMAGVGGQSTFVLPRDARVLRDSTRNIVSALIGLSWGGRELLDVLSGCVAAPAGPVTGERIGSALRVVLSPTAEAWLRQRGGRWQVVAARVEGWLVEYRTYDATWPSHVRITANGATPLDLQFSVSQVRVNVPLPATTFSVTVPDHFLPMTLDELRSIGPMRDRAPRTAAPRTPAPSHP